MFDFFQKIVEIIAPKKEDNNSSKPSEGSSSDNPASSPKKGSNQQEQEFKLSQELENVKNEIGKFLNDKFTQPIEENWRKIFDPKKPNDNLQNNSNQYSDIDQKISIASDSADRASKQAEMVGQQVLEMKRKRDRDILQDSLPAEIPQALNDESNDKSRRQLDEAIASAKRASSQARFAKETTKEYVDGMHAQRYLGISGQDISGLTASAKPADPKKLQYRDNHIGAGPNQFDTVLQRNESQKPVNTHQISANAEGEMVQREMNLVKNNSVRDRIVYFEKVQSGDIAVDPNVLHDALNRMGGSLKQGEVSNPPQPLRARKSALLSSLSRPSRSQ